LAAVALEEVEGKPSFQGTNAIGVGAQTITSKTVQPTQILITTLIMEKACLRINNGRGT